MLIINKVRPNHVIDFAAEELKKYLRMMMPACGEIDIRYAPDATDGFRLGLLEDFGLPSEAEDPVLDDVIHIDTQPDGGILAGSNPRSVLFAVYRLLRENGCRWLYPGLDGEHVPVADLTATRYHKLADHRFRGHCNEGAESQQAMLETIDFYAKLELNVYMLEFDIPYYYYDLYYSHFSNEKHRAPEPITHQQVLQWKRQCEVEISKRGLQFHDMGHGWTAEPFGLDSTEGWVSVDPVLTDLQRDSLALLNGERKLFRGIALNTNLCMSKARVRSTMADSIVAYAETHQNVDYLHVWLADGSLNHCECEECQKARPSDFYLMIMNELDEKLTQKGLATRIVFIAYVDTLFAPRQVQIKNPNRFSLLYAPISRSYFSSITENSVIPEAPEYERNRWERPKSSEANMAFLRDWQKTWNGPAFSYEYHYWKHQYYDPGLMFISRRIYEDIRALKFMGLDGFVEDGSQRSFFPNGFHMYIFAEALMNRDCDYDAVMEDYFRHIYGDAWQEAKAYLQKVTDVFDFACEKVADPHYSKGTFYDPDYAKQMASVKDIAAEGRALALQHLSMPTRPQTISMRLLLRHAEYIEGMAEFLAEKALGKDTEAEAKFEQFLDTMGKYEWELERYLDHGLMAKCLRLVVKRPTVVAVEGL